MESSENARAHAPLIVIQFYSCSCSLENYVKTESTPGISIETPTILPDGASLPTYMSHVGGAYGKILLYTFPIRLALLKNTPACS